MTLKVQFNQEQLKELVRISAKGTTARLLHALVEYDIDIGDRTLAVAMNNFSGILQERMDALVYRITSNWHDYYKIVEEEIEKETGVSVILEGFEQSKKIAVIKVTREITGLGLKEAKELVEAAPKPVKKNISRQEAEEIKIRLEESGGKASLT
jgi:ribosomal protein L7/L12